MRVVIVGIGVLGEELVAALLERKHEVIAIDIDAQVCDRVYSHHGVVAVHGSGTDLHVLQQARVDTADAVVMLMHQDSDNVTCTLLSRSLGVPQLIARMRDNGYEDSYRAAGISHLVRVSEVLRNQIMTQLEHPRIEELIGVGDHQVRIFSVQLDESAPAVGQKVVDLAQHDSFPERCLLLGSFRGDSPRLHVLRGGDSIEAGDTVLIIAGESDIDSIMKVVVG